MTDEVKVTEEKETKCFCQKKEFRNFLTIALGTFVGVYCALSLFAALHRPPMIRPFGPCGFYRGGCPIQKIHHRHHFDRGDRFDKGEFQQKNIPDDVRKAPFEPNKAKNDD